MFDPQALADNRINSDVAAFFVSYIFIGSVVLFNGLCSLSLARSLSLPF